MDYQINKTDYILVLDSGNGGKYTLKVLSRYLPNEKFIFLEDDKNAPYGSKSKKKLFNLARKNINFMLKNYPIKLIVLACNTLSSACYDMLKKEFPFIKIIPVFPLIKKYRRPTLLLCTDATKKYNKAINDIAKCDNIEILSFKNLAKKIDENIENLSVLQPFLDKKLKKYAKMHIRQVVLGCTHYNLIKKQISNSLLDNRYSKSSRSYKQVNANFKGIKVYKLKDGSITFFESSYLVAKQTSLVLSALSLKNKTSTSEIRYLRSSILNIN